MVIGDQFDEEPTCDNGQCFVAGILVLIGIDSGSAPNVAANAPGYFKGKFAAGIGLLLAGPAGYFVLTAVERKRRKSNATPEEATLGSALVPLRSTRRRYVPPDGGEYTLEPVWEPLRPSGCGPKRGWLSYCSPGLRNAYALSQLAWQ